MDISVVGAAAVWDYLFQVDRLPEVGDIVQILADCPTPYSGGCAPNIAMGLKTLGVNVVNLHYPVGNDAVTSGITKIWHDSGIICDGVVTSEYERSGAAWQFMQADGSTMCFAYPGVTNKATADLAIPLGSMVIICPVLNQFTYPVLEQAIRTDRFVLTTGIADASIVSLIKDLDVLIVNHHEADKLCRYSGCDSIEELAQLMNGLVYVTRGRNGSTLYQAGERFVIPPIQAKETLDVTGAGDAYTAGVAFGLAAGMDPQIAAYVGACYSSFVVESWGSQTNFATLISVVERVREQFPQMANEMKNYFDRSEK